LLIHPLTQEEEQPTFAFPFSPAEIDRGAVYEFNPSRHGFNILNGRISPGVTDV
jgi:hypothetical protein